MTEIEKKGIGKTKIGFIVCAVLVVILVFSNILFYSAYRDEVKEHNYLVEDYNALNSNYTNLIEKCNSLVTTLDELNLTYMTALHELNFTLQNLLQDLQEELENLLQEYQGALKVPYTTIVGGNVTWVFRTLDGSIKSWYMPIETYVYYVNQPKPEEYHYLTTDGQTFTVRNYELFVQPEFFSEVISGLTDENTARDFVREVFNLRVQMTVYSEDITDTPQWSAETMTEGAGDCEDFAILMGSLLVAGNEHANYGMKVQMVYMDADNPTNR